MKNVCNFIKKHWILILILFALPFLFEMILIYTPEISKFSNETWFSFMGSYVGAIITLIVMFISFKKSDEENKKMIRIQKKQHQFDMQNQKIVKIIHVLLLDDYVFTNINTICENIDRYITDFQYVQLDTLSFKYADDNILKDEKLIDALLELQTEEVKIVNKLVDKVPHVDSSEKANDLLKIFLDAGCELSKIANLRRESIKVMYENYLKNVYENYYE